MQIANCKLQIEEKMTEEHRVEEIHEAELSSAIEDLQFAICNLQFAISHHAVQSLR
jgi:hypothetical protein